MPTAAKQPPPLREELAFFQQHRADWLASLESKYVLVVGSRLVGVYESREAAYRGGLEQFGNVPMLIKRISNDERIEFLPALSLGLIDVHI